MNRKIPAAGTEALGRRIRIACHAFSVAASLDRTFARRAMSTATELVEAIPSFEERAKHYEVLARHAAIEREFYFARILAERSAIPDYVLRGYAQILDSMLIKKDGVTWNNWGAIQAKLA